MLFPQSQKKIHAIKKNWSDFYVKNPIHIFSKFFKNFLLKTPGPYNKYLNLSAGQIFVFYKIWQQKVKLFVPIHFSDISENYA